MIEFWGCAQVVAELMNREQPSGKRQETCNVLWGLAALGQLKERTLKDLSDSFVQQSGAVQDLTFAEAHQLHQV